MTKTSGRAAEVMRLFDQGDTAPAIARKLKLGRATVRDITAMHSMHSADERRHRRKMEIGSRQMLDRLRASGFCSSAAKPATVTQPGERA